MDRTILAPSLEALIEAQLKRAREDREAAEAAVEFKRNNPNDRNLASMRTYELRLANTIGRIQALKYLADAHIVIDPAEFEKFTS